ncbi:hypothetical protein RQP46_003912 [Phenoliferia psychrophenolica]
MVQIENNVFYVTGGCSGLGLATVHELVKKGAYVAVLDMNVEAGERLEKELNGLVKFVRCDVRSEDDVVGAIAKVDEKWGARAVGGVVHCGGIARVGKTVGNDGKPFSLDLFREVVDINLVGSFNIARLVAARIIKSTPAVPSYKNPGAPAVDADRGVIILVSSVSYEEGQMGQAAYASSKAGVVGLALPMARDLARYGIRVVAVAPSLFGTAMGASMTDKVREGLLKATVFPPRMGLPEEFAHLSIAILGNQMLNVIRLDGASRMAKM